MEVGEKNFPGEPAKWSEEGSKMRKDRLKELCETELMLPKSSIWAESECDMAMRGKKL